MLQLNKGKEHLIKQYIRLINKYHTQLPWEENEIETWLDKISEFEGLKPLSKTKSFHLNPSYKYDLKQLEAMKKINMNSVQKKIEMSSITLQNKLLINKAISELQEEGKKVSIVEVHKKTKVSRTLIYSYYKQEEKEFPNLLDINKNQFEEWHNKVINLITYYRKGQHDSKNKNWLDKALDLIHFNKKEEKPKVNDVVSTTYDWMKTAFNELNLTDEELIEKAELIKKLCIEEIDEFIGAVKENNHDEKVNACADLLVVASNMPFYAGIPLQDLKDECRDTYFSNMTKFCKTEEEAKHTVSLYKSGEHPNKLGVKIDCFYAETGNKNFPYKILSIPDNKILKGKEFRDVNYFKN